MSLAVPDCFPDASLTVSLCYCRSPHTEEINAAEALLRSSSNKWVYVSDRRVGRRDQKERRIGFDVEARHCRFPCRATSEKAKFRPSILPNK
jgi:hypothetical protein